MPDDPNAFKPKLRLVGTGKPARSANRTGKRTSGESDRSKKTSKTKLPPKATPAAPAPPPAGRRGEANAEVDRLASEIHSTLDGLCPGLISDADRAVIIMLARNLIDYRQQCEITDAPGFERVKVGGNGGSYLNPHWTARLACEKQIESLLKQLGMTPAARARLGADLSTVFGGQGGASKLDALRLVDG